MPKRSWNLNTVYISERLQECLRPICRAALTTVVAPMGYGKTRPKTVTKRIARLYPQFKEGQVLDEAFIKTLPKADQEAADQINRRTEFQVLTTDFQPFVEDRKAADEGE